MKLLAFLILCFASAVVLTDDFKTIDGHEYKNAKVSRIELDLRSFKTGEQSSRVAQLFARKCFAARDLLRTDPTQRTGDC